MKRLLSSAVVLSMAVLVAVGQPMSEPVDTAVVSKIKDEGFSRSRVMEYASYLTDVYGPRLTWSPEYRRGADWISGEFKKLGLTNIRYDYFKPVGKGWTLKKFNANMIAPVATPLIAYPKAWSPGTKGAVKGPVVVMKAQTSAELQQYKGKLKNAYVFLGEPRELKAWMEAPGKRLTDAELLAMANSAGGAGRMGRMMRDSSALQRFVDQANFAAERHEFCMKEGAAMIVDAGRGDGGTIFVAGASVPRKIANINEMFGGRTSPYDPEAPEIMPQVSLAAEHYNRIVRMVEKGEKVQLEMQLDVSWSKPDSGFNVLAEIPGTDLKDEVVMIGGHFDTWHAGTGATDNSSGTAVCLEAVRILQTLGLKPRRTIRVGLWGGEEQGLYGSREYVAEHLADRQSSDMLGMMMGRNTGPLVKKPAYDKFSVYFNNDNGTGRVRGVYMQGNESVRPIFQAILKAANDPTAQTLTIDNTSGTDHLAFDGVGLPGFQFIQDPVEYETRTHHSNMDVFDRLQADDLKQGAVMMAIFAYQAAMRDGLYPRKPMPGGGGRPVSSN
jgi:hypothetical protein